MPDELQDAMEYTRELMADVPAGVVYPIPPTWQEVALELAVVVNRQRIHRMNSDMLLGWELAKEVLKLKGE